MKLDIKGDINKLPNVKKKTGVKDEDIKRASRSVSLEALRKEIKEKDELIAKLQNEVSELNQVITTFQLKSKRADWVRWRLGINNGR